MATTEDINVEQGADFSAEITVLKDGLPFDLTGYTLTGQVRRTMNSTDVDTTLTLILHDTKTNVIVLSISSAATTSLSYKRYVYDIEASKDGVVHRIIQGFVNVSPNVTR
jgi:hypothetical protein